MSRRGRLIGYGLSAALVLAGVLGAVFVHGLAGQLMALVLISLGLVLAACLVFLEVGLSEDRERARERRLEERRARAPRPAQLPRLRGGRRRFR